MKNKKILHFISVLFLFLSSFQYINHLDWGFFGHRQINRMAVFTLPPDLMRFYKPNIDFLTEHAIDPDKRRYASRFEAERHFINPDEIDVYPFNVFPRKWTAALAKFTDIYVVTSTNDTLHLFGRFQMDFEMPRTITLHSKDLQKSIGRDSLVINKSQYLQFIQANIVKNYYETDWIIPKESLDSIFSEDGLLIPFKLDIQQVFAKDRLSPLGILPWHLQAMQYRLTRAFEANDIENILRLSSDFGHYIADAHVPLHTTRNYNGQYTNQKGIHSFWESRLPELFSENSYDFFVGKATYIEDATTHYWDIILESHRYVDSVLLIEQALRKEFSEDKIYCYETVGNNTLKTYCQDYADAYHTRLQGMVERRMQKAIKAVGDAWFTAWVDAGQPNLKVKTKIELKEAARKELEAENEAFRVGKILGRAHEN